MHTHTQTGGYFHCTEKKRSVTENINIRVLSGRKGTRVIRDESQKDSYRSQAWAGALPRERMGSRGLSLGKGS